MNAPALFGSVLLMCLQPQVAAPASVPAATAPPAAPTFATDIAAILHRNCVQCHRAGGGAPFALVTYADAKRKSATIAEVVSNRSMPPWPPTQGAELFSHARVLAPQEIAALVAWDKAGTPEGDAARTPAAPVFASEWALGEPDLVVEMKAPFMVAPSGRDIYRNFVFPLGTTEEKWLSAIDLRPSAPSVVHHALYFIDTKGIARAADAKDESPGFSGGAQARFTPVGGWAVGGVPQRIPQGLGRPLAAGSDLVVQVHFHPSGKAESETLKLGLYFCKAKPARTLLEFQLPPVFGRLSNIDIPPGMPEYALADSFVVPAPIELLSVWGHAHMVCSSMRATATLPDGTVRALLTIPHWDFNWQMRYDFREPILLPAGTRIDAAITYDNSEANSANPNTPPKRIRWGEQTTDEMGSLIFNCAAAHEGDLPALAAAYARHLAGMRPHGKPQQE